MLRIRMTLLTAFSIPIFRTGRVAAKKARTPSLAHLFQPRNPKSGQIACGTATE
jgi:hypothetical protein